MAVKVEYTVRGLDELIKDMNRHLELADRVFDEMLEAGAEEVKQVWIRTANKYDHRDTGDMIAAIDWVKRPSGLGGLKNAHIYPQGKDKRGTRNASKAFWRHYGTSKKVGTYWVDTANEEANRTVPPILFEMWKNFLRGEF